MSKIFHREMIAKDGVFPGDGGWYYLIGDEEVGPFATIEEGVAAWNTAKAK